MYDDKIAQLTNAASATSGDLQSRHKQELEAMRAALERASQEAITALQKKHEAAVKDMTTSFESQIKNANADAKKKLDDLDAQHKKNVDALTKDYEGRIASLQARVDDLLAKTSGDTQQAQNEITTLKASIEALRKEHSIATAALDQKRISEVDAAVKTAAEKEQLLTASHAAEVKRLEAQIAELQKKLAKDSEVFRAELQSVKQQASDELEKLKAAHAAQLRDATSSKDRDGALRMQQELEKLRKELSDAFDSQKTALIAKHDESLGNEKKRYDSMKAQLEAEIAALKAQIEQLQAKSHDASSCMAAVIEQLKRDATAAKDAHAAEIARLTEAHSAEVATLKRQLADREADLTGEGQRALASLKADYEAKLLKLGDDARAAQKDMDENYKNRIASLEKRKDEEIARTVKELQDKKAEELRVAQAAFDKELDAVKKSRDMLEKELKALCAQVKDAEGKILALQSKCAEESASREDDRRKHDALVADMRQAFDVEKVELQEGAALELQKLKDKSDEERRAFQAKIKQLQKHIAELEYKYANRESRQEDVDKINQLLRENKEKEEALIKAFNDMKFYKLELVNREESYNKVFGRQPSIANGPQPGAAAAADSAKSTLPSTTAPSKMETAQIPPNMKRTKSMAAEK